MRSRLPSIRVFAAAVAALAVLPHCASDDTVSPVSTSESPLIIKITGNTWYPLGPDLTDFGENTNLADVTHVTGRVTAIAVNPSNPLNDVWIGAASGGVWHGSVGASPSWTPMTDDQPSLATGIIRLSGCTSTRCSTVWVGTGEDAARRDTYYGRGLLKGTWNGSKYVWTQLGANHFALGSITGLVVDPTNAQRVFVALSSGLTSNATQSSIATQPPGAYGIWQSLDGGTSWTNVWSPGAIATDLEMDPGDPNTLYAGFRGLGVYRSTNGGTVWSAINSGVSASDVTNGDWPEVAVTRAGGLTTPKLYRVTSTCPSPFNHAGSSCVAKLYASTNGGTSWSVVWTPPGSVAYGQPLHGYSSYTHQITVHPTDANHLWIAGTGLYESTNGGTSFNTVAPDTLHPDHHALVAVANAGCSGGLCLFNGNDGGFFFSSDAVHFSATYQEGLELTQVQSIATSPFTSDMLIGTQDNGAQYWSGSATWELVDNNDAASTVMDADDVQKMYDVYTGSPPQRCINGGNFCNRAWPGAGSGLPVEDTAFYPPIVQDWNAQGSNHPLYFAMQRPQRSTNDATSWSAAGSGMPTSTAFIPFVNAANYISTLAIAKSDSNRAYAGYYNGEIWTTANALAATPSWTRIDKPTMPTRVVSSIVVHPTQPLEAYVSYSGFGASSVWQTTDGGTSFADYSQNSDPGNEFATRPVNALTSDSGFASVTLWAGTDEGVYSRNIGSATWNKSSGLPNVAVNALTIKDSTLFAATHGRGVWGLSMSPFVHIYIALCCGYISIIDPPPDGVIFGHAFDPGQACSVKLYEGTRVCTTTSTDAEGAAISTDSRGNVVSTKTSGIRRPMARLARSGTLAGGIASTNCRVSQVDLTCGTRTQTTLIGSAADAASPPSTGLRVAPSVAVGQAATLTLAPTIRRAGSVSELCRVSTSVSSTTTADAALSALASAVNASPVCARSGVQATVRASSAAGAMEDDFAAPARLSLVAPSLSGQQLVTKVVAPANVAAAIEGFGDTPRKLMLASRVTFAGNASGGSLRVSSRSPLGTCAFTVPTAAGDTPAVVARKVYDAFAAPRANPQVLPASPACLDSQNMRDARLSGSTITFPISRGITVSSTDPSTTATLDVEP